MVHPALDPAELRRCLQDFLHADLAGGPIEVFASYEHAPDLRLTASFPTTSERHPTVVVKSNRFPFLKSAARAHLIAASGELGLVPRVLGFTETDLDSILILERFEGEPLAGLGEAGLRAIAKSLGQIQLSVSWAQVEDAGLSPIEVSEIRTVFERCEARILGDFDLVWRVDEGSKLSKALCGRIDEIPARLRRTESSLGRWIAALQEPTIKPSIVHGDLHAGNAVMLPSGSALIFDWETGYVSHPFLSMEKLLTSAWGLDMGADGGPWGYVRETPTQDRLKHTYLESFQGDPRVLSRAFDAAMSLAVILEMDFEMRWADATGWPNGNPEWTAQLLNRLCHHHSYFDVNWSD